VLLVSVGYVRDHVVLQGEPHQNNLQSPYQEEIISGRYAMVQSFLPFYLDWRTPCGNIGTHKLPISSLRDSVSFTTILTHSSHSLTPKVFCYLVNTVLCPNLSLPFCAKIVFIHFVLKHLPLHLTHTLGHLYHSLHPQSLVQTSSS